MIFQVPFYYSNSRLDASWERDHLGRLAKRAGRPRSQQRTYPSENCSSDTSVPKSRCQDAVGWNEYNEFQRWVSLRSTQPT